MSIFDAVKEQQNAESIASLCTTPAKEPLKYVCPFCGSGTGTHRTAALSLDPRTGYFRCFACGFSGDAIELLKASKGYSTAEAICKAKDRIWYIETEEGKEQRRKSGDPRPAYNRQGVHPRGGSAGSEARTPEKGRQVIYACRKAGKNDKDFKAYLRKRGITAETAERFRIGLHTWNRQDGSRLKYLLIPYNDTYFTRRLITEAEGVSKYQKDKGRAPALFYATADGESIPADAVLFVTEGEIDAILLAQAGFQAVALGSASNFGHLIPALPLDFCGSVKLCLDADADGETAAAKLGELLSRQGINHSKAVLPTGYKDVGEVAEKAAAENRDPVIEVRKVFAYDIQQE